MREDLERRGLSAWESGRYDEWDPAVDGPYDPDADYYSRESKDAEKAERAVESSMLLGERFDRAIVAGFEGVGAILGGLLKVTGLVLLLWGFIWLVKTLWYLS